MLNEKTKQPLSGPSVMVGEEDVEMPGEESEGDEE
jgi:hypothetical protein